MRALWNSRTKNLENIQKNIRTGALFYKNYTADTILVVITKEKMFKKSPLYSCPFFSDIKGLPSRKSYFNKTGSNENVF